MTEKAIDILIAQSQMFQYNFRHKAESVVDIEDFEARVVVINPVQGVSFPMGNESTIYGKSLLYAKDVTRELVAWAIQSGDLFHEWFQFDIATRHMVQIPGREVEGKLRLNLGFLNTIDLEGEARQWFESKFIMTGDTEEYKTRDYGMVIGNIYIPSEEACTIFS